MKTLDKAIYIDEVFWQCRHADEAFSLMKRALRGCNDPKEKPALRNALFHDVFRQLQSFLTHAANVSKLLRPDSNPASEEKTARAAYLTDVLKVDDNHPIHNRDLRDGFECYDEQLDKWMQGEHNDTIRHVIQDPTSPNIRLDLEGVNPLNVMRWYDPKRETFYFIGNKYGLKELLSAIHEIGEEARLLLNERGVEENGSRYKKFELQFLGGELLPASETALQGLQLNPSFNSIDEFLLQIEKTLQVQAYYASLFLCLCLPDIASALESADGRASGKKYKEWFDANMTTELSRDPDVGDFYKGAATYKGILDSNEAYLLRCAALHQGQLANTGSPKSDSSQFSKIIFQEPSKGGLVAHGLVNKDSNGRSIKYLNLTEFCKDTIGSTKVWLAKVKGTASFERNYSVMFKRYPNGLLPFCSGFPIIT